MRLVAALGFLALVVAACSSPIDREYEAYALVKNAAGNPTAGVVVDLTAERKSAAGAPFSASNFYTSGPDGLAGPLRFGTKLTEPDTVVVTATARASGVTNSATVTYGQAELRDSPISVVVPLTVP
jgi:hypothetical protein